MESKNKKIQDKKILFFILILVFFLLSIFLFFKLIDKNLVLEEKEIYAKIIISDHYGFDVDNSALIFGMITPGDSALREISLKNYYNQNVKVKIYAEGNISDFISVSENNFILNIDEDKNLSFSVLPLANVKEGVYEGYVKLVFSKI